MNNWLDHISTANFGSPVFRAALKPEHFGEVI